MINYNKNVGNEGFGTTLILFIIGFFIAKLAPVIINANKNSKEQEEIKKKLEKICTPFIQKYIEKALKYRNEFKSNAINLTNNAYKKLLKCAYAEELVENNFKIDEDVEDNLLYKNDKEFITEVTNKVLDSFFKMYKNNKYSPIIIFVGRFGVVGYNEKAFNNEDYDDKFDKFIRDIEKIKNEKNYYIAISPIDDQIEFDGYIDLGITANDIKKIIIDAKDIKEDKGNESLCSDYIYLLDL